MRTEQAGSSRELISLIIAEVPAISSLSSDTDDQRNLIDCVIKTDDNGYAILGSRVLSVKRREICDKGTE
jgi:hypothetical protein